MKIYGVVFLAFYAFVSFEMGIDWPIKLFKAVLKN